MALRYYQGTVVGQGSRLDQEATVKKLRKAMKGFGTDEKAIIEVLSTHTNQELQLIKDYYKTCYGRILAEDIMDELSGHFEKLCLYLLLPRPHFQAYCLHQAMEVVHPYYENVENNPQGIGTNETALIEILCTSNNNEIQAIKEAYKERFQEDLEKDLESDTSGHFRRALVSLVQGNRSEEQAIDSNEVSKEARELRKAGVKKIGTDESVFNRILCSRSVPHLQAVFDEYRTIDKQDITEAIKSEMSGSARDAYLAIARYVMEPLEYFAECLYKSMEGAGTDDERLMQLVVNHCEIDLKDIAETYLKKYKKGLSRAIQDDTSGDYRKLLTRLTNLSVMQPPPDPAMLTMTDMDQPQPSDVKSQ